MFGMYSKVFVVWSGGICGEAYILKTVLYLYHQTMIDSKKWWVISVHGWWLSMVDIVIFFNYLMCNLCSLKMNFELIKYVDKTTNFCHIHRKKTRSSAFFAKKKLIEHPQNMSKFFEHSWTLPSLPHLSFSWAGQSPYHPTLHLWQS